MTTFIQLHILTAYPPANLNRDDTGKPKTAQFGGAERLRVSSQALKRAWRTSAEFKQALDGHIGERTQRLGDEIEQHLKKTKGIHEAKAREIARAIADRFGKPKPDKDPNPARIEQLAFISPEERAAAFALAERAAGESVDIENSEHCPRGAAARDGRANRHRWQFELRSEVVAHPVNGALQ